MSLYNPWLILYVYMFRYFKYYRISALHKIIQDFQHADSAKRLRHLSLALGALVIYQLNALIYRPAEGNAETKLLEAACQHIHNGPDDLSTHPIMYERGAYFLSDVTNDGGYALPMVRPVDPDILMKLYRRGFWDDMEAEFYVAPIQNKDTNTSHPVCRKSLTRKLRTTTRFIEAVEGDDEHQLTGVTEPVESDDDQQPLTERITEFIEPAEINNHRRQRTKTKLRPAGAMESEESAESTSEESEEDDISPGEFNNIIDGIPGLSDILRQFPTDVCQLAPTPRSDEDGKWMLLDPLDKAQAKISMFQSLRVGRFFSQAQCWLMTATEWKDKVFLHYFSHKGVQPGNTRHFPSATYYMQ